MARPCTSVRRCVALLCASLLAGLAAVQADEEVVVEGCTAPVVVFGASMVDEAENSMAQPLSSSADFVPYGVDYFGKPAGRWSNGRVISDFIGQGLGYGLLEPYLNAVDPNFKHGVNFASSGSTAQSSGQGGSSTRGAGLFQLDVQVKQYKAFKERIQHLESKNKDLKSLKLPATSSLAKGIHIMMPAHNDYSNALLGSTNFDAASLVTDVVGAIETSLRDIHSEGARTMILMNVLPLGCAPSFLAYAATTPPVKFDNDSCIASYNSLVELHNSHLKDMVIDLRTELAWEGLVLFDFNALYLDAVRHPSKYGATKPFVACCGSGGEYNVNLAVACGKTGVVNGVTVTGGRCSDPTKHISWDGLHPIESFAKQIAYAMLKGEFMFPNLSMKEACKP